MAAPPPGMTPQQFAALQQHMQQQIAAEAAKRGMTVEEFSKMQREQLNAEAAKAGMTPEQYINQLRMRALQQRAAMQQQMQQQQQQGGQGQTQGQGQGQGQQGQGQPQVQHVQHVQQQVSVNPNAPPNPKAIALAKWLRSQNLKARTCILDGQRREMFKVKRALRALESPEYQKAAAKNKLLPPVTDRASAENAFKLLPLSFLALRVSKVSSNYNKGKRVKGLWTVKVEQHQDTDPMTHYVWLYEGPQWKQKALAAAFVIGIFAIVLFPLWPIMLRQGVWYLSVGMLGLLGLFFALAIVRLILFCVTVFVVPPGIWLFPNLFEDVGFIDSFKPLWAWNEKKKKPKKAKAAVSKSQEKGAAPTTAAPEAPTATTTSSEAQPSSSSGTASKRNLAASVEDAEED
ncbi:hypothetical protein VTN49DRAFT_3561 [Thermomyces lanuginosus]|uniref:uncharacterized protein n=1 Tax=Thermomyces lanuginosus TaxID=5541 RepID=UPI0037434AD1